MEVPQTLAGIHVPAFFLPSGLIGRRKRPFRENERYIKGLYYLKVTKNEIKTIKMENGNLFEEFEQEERDESILDEIEAKKRASKKSFGSIINKKKFSKYELDEVMV